ncbi:DUF2200 domain-containing protein [Humibacillus xanthopallidus]|uniref:Uncharacterized protein n=1 Tax=Humibacillus xanthopallidus TaxID=412689 RepID=A0A543I365_9MICO|nr:DUF2200 domain-containing protein [Humibacillus xanthopallidus]TQM65007.1 hypothetical protein FBY41_1389 [Humibacillus xanthopallidus]
MPLSDAPQQAGPSRHRIFDASFASIYPHYVAKGKKMSSILRGSEPVR